MKWIKQIYDWVLNWEKSPYSMHALFLLAMIESIFFPVPPDVLLIALALGNSFKALKFAAIATVGSVVGAAIGFAIGHYSWLTSTGEFTAFANFFFNNIPGFSHELYYKIKELFELWNFWIIFTAGFTPIPYKVFTITAGVFDINFFMFILASIISRAGRFFLVAFLIWKFGPTIKEFIDKYFNILALGFTVLLIGGFVAIKYLI